MAGRPSDHRRPRRLRWSALLVVAAVVAACGGGGADSARSVSQDPRAEENLAYGVAPAPDDSVTLQDDVVIVAGGGEAIRGVDDGGLTWLLDPDADGAGDLEVDKVMFVTGRAVGRVLHLAEEGGDLRVTVGPVELTDVIRDGTFRQEGIPIDDPIEYPAVDSTLGLAEEEADGTVIAEQAAGEVVLASTSAAAPGRALAASGPVAAERSSAPAEVVAAPGSATPFCCGTGAGVRFNYNQGGTKLFGQVQLTFKRPTVSFLLAIERGRVTRAEVNLDGDFGTSLDFEAGIESGNGAQRVRFPVGREWVIPVPVAGIPLSVTVSQALVITTAFGTTLGTIRGSGSFSLGGSIGYGYSNGSFGDRSTRRFKKTWSLMDSLTGVPVGVMGLLVQHRVRLDVGFSSYVLKAGLYADVTTGIGATRGSALGAVGTAGSHFVECQGVGLGVHARFGMGFSILRPVVQAINKLLSLIRVKPIKAEIGPVSDPVQIYANEEVKPSVALCGHTPRG